MTCDTKGVIIRLGGGQGPPIGTLIRERRLAAFPVVYAKHVFWECAKLAPEKVPDGHKYSWTLDTYTLQHYARGFDLVEYHLTHLRVSIPFRIPTATFVRAGHSSFDCDDKKMQRLEKWHCPWAFFEYDAELAARYPPPERPVQAILL